MAGNTYESYAPDVIMGAKDEDATSTTSGTSATSHASVHSWASGKKPQKKQAPAAKSRSNITSTRTKPCFAAVNTRNPGPSTGQGKGHYAHASSYTGKGGKSAPYNTDTTELDPWSESDLWSSSLQSHQCSHRPNQEHWYGKGDTHKRSE